jgi:preprotein translocase subunit SecB
MAESKISPVEYKKFIDGLNLTDIKLTHTNVSIEESFKLPASINIKDKSSYKNISSDKIKVSIEYKLDALPKGQEQAGFKIEVHYDLIYNVKIPMNDKIFKIFSESSLRIQTWPYFRQFVHQMTLYMNLPPLILGTVRSPG